MSEGYAYLGAGESGKLKFPDEHAEWTRNLAEQGYARIAAENAAKAEKKAERERSKIEAKGARTGRKSSATSNDRPSSSRNESQIGDGEVASWCLERASKRRDMGANEATGTGIQKETKKSVFGFLKRASKDEKESVIR